VSGRGRDDPREAERVGLCVRCRHGRRQESAKGSVFWRCLRARTDPRFLPYPPLPVRACPGFERVPR
jgi:hypothetical protein